VVVPVAGVLAVAADLKLGRGGGDAGRRAHHADITGHLAAHLVWEALAAMAVTRR
jgi:hypothetical protein